MQLLEAAAEPFSNSNQVLLQPGNGSSKYISDMIEE